LQAGIKPMNNFIFFCFVLLPDTINNNNRFNGYLRTRSSKPMKYLKNHWNRLPKDFLIRSKPCRSCKIWEECKDLIRCQILTATLKSLCIRIFRWIRSSSSSNLKRSARSKSLRLMSMVSVIWIFSLLVIKVSDEQLFCSLKKTALFFSY